MDKNTETVVPISKAVTAAFTKTGNVYFAQHENGSLYISNGYFIMKANEAEFGVMLEEIYRRQKTENIAVEKPELLKYIDSDRGKFELSHEPLEFEMGDNKIISLFADGKQYFGYDKKYTDVFRNGENRLFVDDNADYNPLSHNMIVKSPAGEVLGAVLPLRLPEQIYKELADVLPLKIAWKTEYERIKENPAGDPYIGKEFFDGRDTHIIAAIKEVGGANHYVVPNVKDGKVSGYADYVKVDEIENFIARWEESRVYREKDNQAPPAEEESPPAKEEETPPARPFTHIRKSPWGEVTASEKLCPGVFSVQTEKQGGVMVALDMTAALSTAALKCGTRFNGFMCFEDNGAKETALRELLDKKLWVAPVGVEDKINQTLRERQPEYWRSREKGHAQKRIERKAPAAPAFSER